MYEVLLSEWHISPREIEEHWTDREFLMYLDRMRERLEKQHKQQESVRRRKGKPGLVEYLRNEGIA